VPACWRRRTPAARRSGEEYLLERGLFRRRSTGEPIGPWVREFGYPFRWPGERMAEAIALIREAGQADGTWLQQRTDSGRVWFAVDVPAGQPSKWLTLFATRVPNWWDAR
jgi:hypothetical protein